jgi:glyoxylate/hydroxypyruvate reductase A
MSLLIISNTPTAKHNGWAQNWVKALHQKDPNLDIQIWPEVSDPNSVEFVLVWVYPQGELRKYPNLKGISSTGAGVDHILSDAKLPPNIPIARLIDPHLVHNMSQYAVWAVLNHLRGFEAYAQAQARSLWVPRSLASEPQVGIMGLGQLGRQVAQQLYNLGIKVIGWSRSPKAGADMQTYHGDEQLKVFLNQTDVLICLLPLTAETRNILNQSNLKELRKGAYLINVARGEHLVEKDLLAALDSQQLSGACLDVFQTEPLPEGHPFWQHPKIRITPHIASVTDTVSAAAQVLDNYQRALAGKPLLNAIDLTKGY